MLQPPFCRSSNISSRINAHGQLHQSPRTTHIAFRRVKLRVIETIFANKPLHEQAAFAPMGCVGPATLAAEMLFYNVPRVLPQSPNIFRRIGGMIAIVQRDARNI